MEKERNNKGLIAALLVIIILLATLCVLFATGKITLNNQNNINDESANNNSGTQDNSSQINETNYDNFIGKWTNSTTKNEKTIKNITNNEITFTWFLYRLAGIDDGTTIPFEDGKAVFYYQGYYDSNYDDKLSEDEKYIRKATIELNNNGVNVTVEDVDSIPSSYKALDNFDGCWFITAGTYTHPEKE